MEKEVQEKLEKLERLEKKEALNREKGKAQYRNWRAGYVAKCAFYDKWYGKKVGNVELK